MSTIGVAAGIATGTAVLATGGALGAREVTERLVPDPRSDRAGIALGLGFVGMAGSFIGGGAASVGLMAKATQLAPGAAGRGALTAAAAGALGLGMVGMATAAGILDGVLA